MKKALLWTLCVALTLFFLKSPQGLVFPLWILVYLLKDTIRPITDRVSLPTAFIASGFLFGLLTETFAIMQNWNVPAGDKILLHPNPLVDILFGAPYYFFFMVTWYLVLRKIRFSSRDIFIISGLFGVLTEQSGAIALGMLANPLLGTLMALLIACVYGIFPTLAHQLTENRFPPRPKPVAWQYLAALFSLLIFWALYGNIFYKLLAVFFPR